ncbi:MAG: ABC transporter permease [Steroidobacteraceae bacterium]
MNAPAETVSSGFRRRLLALTRKEVRQLLRDRSNLMMGIALPIVLILIFGYGMSFDVKNSLVAVVMEDHSPTAIDAIAGLPLSPYFSPVMVASMHDAQLLMQQDQIDGIVRIPPDFSRALAFGSARIEVVVQALDANRARTVEGYLQGALEQRVVVQIDRAGGHLSQAGPRVGSVTIEPRMWFNAANNSSWFLVPGLIVMIMTLVGAFLTSLVMAREWERGTLEALFVTPVRPMEILLAKMIPYFAVGMVGLILCLLAAAFLFHVPMYGSLLIILLCSVLYLFVALGIGLLISSVTKNQFAASQLALLSSFMPAMILSGFLFDLRNVPAVVRWIGQVLPATYFMELLKSLFLAGDLWPMIFKNCAILLLYAVLLMAATRAVTRKRIA